MIIIIMIIIIFMIIAMIMIMIYICLIQRCILPLSTHTLLCLPRKVTQRKVESIHELSLFILPKDAMTDLV